MQLTATKNVVIENVPHFETYFAVVGNNLLLDYRLTVEGNDNCNRIESLSKLVPDVREANITFCLSYPQTLSRILKNLDSENVGRLSTRLRLQAKSVTAYLRNQRWASIILLTLPHRLHKQYGDYKSPSTRSTVFINANMEGWAVSRY